MAGLSLSVAFLVKQVALFEAVAMYVAVLLVTLTQRETWRQCVGQWAALTCGALLGALPVAVYLLLHVVGSDFIDSFSRGSEQYVTSVSVVVALKNFIARTYDTIAPNSVIFITAIAGFGLMYSIASSSKHNMACSQPGDKQRTGAVILCCWFIASVD